MSSPLAAAIAGLSSAVPSVRQAAAEEVYRLGRATAGIAVSAWWADEELSALLHAPQPTITAGVAALRETFNRIRIANGTPRLAEVPPDQDAEEFELHFPGLHFDVLTAKAPGGNGADARYLSKCGAGIQQVELLCSKVDGAAQLLRERVGGTPLEPNTR